MDVKRKQTYKFAESIRKLRKLNEIEDVFLEDENRRENFRLTVKPNGVALLRAREAIQSTETNGLGNVKSSWKSLRFNKQFHGNSAIVSVTTFSIKISGYSRFSRLTEDTGNAFEIVTFLIQLLKRSKRSLFLLLYLVTIYSYVVVDSMDVSKMIEAG